MADGTAKRMMHERQPERIVSGQAFDEDARIEASVLLVEEDRLLIGADPLGVYEFARPDRKP